MDIDRLCFGRRSDGINSRRSRPRLGSNLPVNQFNDIAVAFLSGPLVWMDYRCIADQTQARKERRTHSLKGLAGKVVC